MMAKIPRKKKVFHIPPIMYEDTSQFSLSLASESCHDERIKSGRMCYSRHTDTIRKSSENKVFDKGHIGPDPQAASGSDRGTRRGRC